MGFYEEKLNNLKLQKQLVREAIAARIVTQQIKVDDIQSYADVLKSLDGEIDYTAKLEENEKQLGA